jgi:hypothetical protein
MLKDITMPRPVKYTVGASRREVYKPAQQACPPQDALPRYYYVQPLQNTPSAWQGAQVYADYEVPAQTGVMTEATLRFQLGSFGPVTDSTPLPVLPSTPFWVDHIEVYIGSDLIETVWKHDIWNEEIGFRTFQELGVVATDVDSVLDGSNIATVPKEWSLYNTNLDGTFPSSLESNSSGNGYWFLNMPTCLRSAKPYVRGFQSRLRFRVYFANTLDVSGVVGAQAPTLRECIMIVEEAQTDPATIAELERAHRQSTVDYTVLVRSRVQQTFASGQISNGNDIQIYLRGFKNKSAGVVVYATNSAAFNQSSSADMNKRYEASIYQLLDAQNNKITERLPVEWLETYVFHDATGSFATTQFDASVSTMIIFPFSADFNTTINKGCSYGGFRFTTLEQLVLNYSGGWNSSTPEGLAVRPEGIAGQTDTVIITSVTYDYAHLTVSGGRHAFRME